MNDPLKYENYGIPVGTLEETLQSGASLCSRPDEDIFLSRFNISGCLTDSVEQLMILKTNKQKNDVDDGENYEEWEEVVTIANIEEMERQRYSIPLDELLRRSRDFKSLDARAIDTSATNGEQDNVVVDKWGFVIDDNKSDGSAASSHRTEVKESKKSREKEALRAEKWAIMLNQWSNMSDDKKKKMKQKFRKGIPDRLRGEMWKKICKVDEFRQKNPGLFQKLLEEESPDEKQIQRDINRTFPKHIFFREAGGKGQTALYNSLKAYSLYDSKTGYCQGMGFIIALLLLYMTEEDAFYLLSRLCQDYQMSGLFQPGFPLLVKFFYIHDVLIDQFLPRLSAHFKNEMINASMYSVQWYTTLYAIALPFPYVLRIFDLFLCEGVRVLFRVALAILKIMQPELMKMDFEETMNRLKNIDKSLTIQPDELIKIAMDFNLPSKRFDKIANDYDEMQGQR